MAILHTLGQFWLFDRRDARISGYLSFLLSLFGNGLSWNILLLRSQTRFWLCAAFGIMRDRIGHFFDKVLRLFRLFSFLYGLNLIAVLVKQLVIGDALDACVDQIERLCQWSVMLAAVPAEEELAGSLRCRWLRSIQMFYWLTLFLLFFKLALFESAG